VTNSVNNENSNLKKALTVWNYVEPFCFKGMKVLDIGAGEGWSKDLLKDYDVEYDFIEHVDLLSEKILETGGKKVANSIEGDISSYYGKYDLILFRHVLEHLLNPREAVEKCSFLLKETGKLYLEVPNGIPATLENISKIRMKGFITSFVRPIHISYFCVENIEFLTSLYGLHPVILDVKNEIHGVFERCERKNVDLNNYYLRNRKLMLRLHYKFFLRDLKNIIKSIIFK
jgi:SAM-dependent methyltransferase